MSAKKDLIDQLTTQVDDLKAERKQLRAEVEAAREAQRKAQEQVARYEKAERLDAELDEVEAEIAKNRTKYSTSGAYLDSLQAAIRGDFNALTPRVSSGRTSGPFRPGSF